MIHNDEPDRQEIALYIAILYVYAVVSGALKVAKGYGGKNKVRQLRDREY